MKTLGGVAAATVLLALCGCSGTPASSSPKAVTTVTVTATPTPGASASDSPTPTVTAAPSAKRTPFAPNVGQYALKVGQTRKGSGLTTRLIAVKVPYPPGEYREPDAGKKFVGLKVRQCLRPDAEVSSDPYYSTYVGEFYAASANGNQVTSSESWDDWPLPKFPEQVTMSPGDCLRGWIIVPVPKAMKVNKIIWRPNDETVAEWRL